MGYKPLKWSFRRNYSAKIIPVKRDRTMLQGPPCPHCKKGNIIFYDRGELYCNACGEVFEENSSPKHAKAFFGREWQEHGLDLLYNQKRYHEAYNAFENAKGFIPREIAMDEFFWIHRGLALMLQGFYIEKNIREFNPVSDKDPTYYFTAALQSFEYSDLAINPRLSIPKRHGAEGDRIDPFEFELSLPSFTLSFNALKYRAISLVLLAEDEKAQELIMNDCMHFGEYRYSQNSYSPKIKYSEGWRAVIELIKVKEYENAISEFKHIYGV
jgi:hypothetical protein